MKKILFFICLFINSFSLIAEEFSLFPWFCSQKEIYNYGINKNWNYKTDITSKIPTFSFKTFDLTYQGNEVSNLTFMFDTDGSLVSQGIVLNDFFSADDVFPTILDLLINDKAQLVTRQINNDDYIDVSIDANISDKIKARYNFYGKNNLFQIAILYYIY